MHELWSNLNHKIGSDKSLKEAIDSPFETVSHFCSLLTEDENDEKNSDETKKTVFNILNILLESCSPKEMFLALINEVSIFQKMDVFESLLILITKALLRMPKKESTLISWKHAITTVYSYFKERFDRLGNSSNKLITNQDSYLFDVNESTFVDIYLFLEFVTPVILELKIVDEYKMASLSKKSKKSQLKSLLIDILMYIITSIFEYYKNFESLLECKLVVNVLDNILLIEPDIVRLNIKIKDDLDANIKKKMIKPKNLMPFNGNITDSLNDNISDSDNESYNDDYDLDFNMNKLIGLIIINKINFIMNIKDPQVYSHNYRLRSFLPLLKHIYYNVNYENSNLLNRLNRSNILTFDLIHIMLLKCTASDGIYGGYFIENLIEPLMRIMITSQSKELTRLCSKVFTNMLKLSNAEDKLQIFTYLMYTFDHIGVHCLVLQHIKEELDVFLSCDKVHSFSESQCITALNLSFRNAFPILSPSLHLMSNEGKIDNLEAFSNPSKNSEINDCLNSHKAMEDCRNSGNHIVDYNNSKFLLEYAGLHLSRLNLLRFLLIRKQTGVKNITKQDLLNDDKFNKNSLEINDTNDLTILENTKFFNILTKICYQYLTKIQQEINFAKAQLTAELNSLVGDKVHVNKNINSEVNIESILDTIQTNNICARVSDEKNISLKKKDVIGDNIKEIKYKPSLNVQMNLNKGNIVGEESQDSDIISGCTDTIVAADLEKVNDDQWTEVLKSRLNELDLLTCVFVRVQELYDNIKFV